MLLLLEGDRQEQISIFPELGLLAQHRAKVFYGLVIMLEVKRANPQQVLSFKAFWVPLGALRKDSQPPLELVVLHEFLAFQDGLVGHRLSPGFLATFLENGIVGCRLVEIRQLVLEVLGVPHVVEVGEGAIYI